ncbi:MAG: ABC transporter permease [Treponema sp.]|nr:ABC transporter permease [Treponema sp.]
MKERTDAPTGKPPGIDQIDRLTGILRPPSFSAAVLLVPFVSILILIMLIFLLSENPARTLFFFFLGPFRNLYSFGNMLNSSIPLIFGALGITIAMKAGCLNLGGEGQIYSGAFTATAAAIALSPLGIAAGIIACLAGALAAGAMSALCGIFKARWNTNELITTFLFSSAAIHVINYLVSGPFQDPESSLQSTGKIAAGLRLPLILAPSNLSAAVFIAVFAAAAMHVFLARTKTGYELRMAGINLLFARYGGINTKLNTVLAMFFSGALYGLAGVFTVFGTHFATVKDFYVGMGWNGLAAALIAGFSPVGVIPAAVFFAWINAGARAAMQNSDITFEVALLVQAVIFFLSTSAVIRNIFSGKKPW